MLPPFCKVMRKGVLRAPLVSVIDVWENMICLRIEQQLVAASLAPDKWDITVFSGPRMIQAFQIAAPAAIEDVRIDRGLDHVKEVTVSVRGVGDTGSSREATVTQKLLPTPSLRQQQILQQELSLHWYFSDWDSPIEKLVSKFEVAVSAMDASSDTETVQEFVCSFDDEVSCLQGNAIIRLAPHLVRESNFALHGRVRCFSHANQMWGQWSQRVRLMCLTPLKVEIRSTTSSSLTVVWGRTKPESPLSFQSIFEADVAVDRFEVIAWPARSATLFDVSGASSPPTKSTSSGQAHTYGLNLTHLDGLEPHVVYNICCRWVQCCGGDWHRTYFRVQTSPEPEIISIPKVGHSFVELHWAPKGYSVSATPTDLSAYIDDNYEWGADHSPTFTIVDNPQDRASDLHRVTISDGIEPLTTIDVQHQQEFRVQRCLVEGLPSAATLRVSVKTASHFIAQGIDHWSWGRTSEAKVVTTVSDLRVIPQERGPNFIVFNLQCDEPQPIRRLEDYFCVEEPYMKASHVTPHSGVYAVEALCEGELFASTIQGDGDKSWGTRKMSLAKSPFTAIRLDSPAKVQLTQLKANWTYRFSINVRDTDGKWWGRSSTLFTTSAEDLFYVRPYVSEGPERHLRIDQAFHDRIFDLASNVSIRYPVMIGEQRRSEISSTSAMLPSRLTSMALKGAVTALGSDHCILEWTAKSVVDGKDGMAIVCHESDAAEVDQFNSVKYALREYKMKVFVTEQESSRLQSQKTGVTETVKEIYFRSAVRTAKLLGLEEGYRYRLAISYFNIVSQKWSPWSELITFRPADRLVATTVRISGTGVTIRWKKQIIPPIDRQQPHTIAPIHYEVTTRFNGNTPVVTEIKQPEYELKDLPTGVVAVSARPWFDRESCGPFSEATYISVTPLKVCCESITQSTAILSWELPRVNPVQGAKGRTILTVSATATNTVATIDLGPLDNNYCLKNLAPCAEYVVSAIQLIEVTGASPPHDFARVDPSKFHTLGALAIEVLDVGEDFAILKWPRSHLPESEEVTHTSKITCLSSPIRPRSSSQAQKTRSSILERYELIVEDSVYGHTEVASVPSPKGTASFCIHKVTGLLPNGDYQARVRIDSESSFFSENTPFRTPGPLKVHFVVDEAGIGTATCRHPLSIGGESISWLAVKTPIEVLIKELPSAPSRKLTGSRAALALLEGKRRFQTRHVFASDTGEVRIVSMPTKGTKVLISARQQAASGDNWLPWVHETVTL